MYSVECYMSSGPVMKPPYFYQVPRNTTHLVSSTFVTPGFFATFPNRSFANLTRLIYLDLSDNDIYTIESGAFECLTNLAVLRLSMNNLDTIESNTFECLTNLIALNLEENDLETIERHTFDSLTNLIALDLFGNALGTIESHTFENLTNLTHLVLNGNTLHGPAVFLRPLSSLRTLVINTYDDEYMTITCSIECIAGEISEMTQLEYLFISTNYVTKENVLQLQNTSVTYFSIACHNEIEKGAFSDWKALNSLELLLDDYQEVSPSHILHLFKNLSGLQAERLYIYNVPSNTLDLHGFEATNLKALAIWYSQVAITGMEELSFESIGVHTLQWLDISHNEIALLNLSVRLHTLQWLDISNNKIASLNLSVGLHSLQWLDVSNNRLASLDLSVGFHSLRWLNVSHNRIASLDLSLGALHISQWMDVSHNRLASLDLSVGVHSLQWLNIPLNKNTPLNILDEQQIQHPMKYVLQPDMLLNQTKLHLSQTMKTNTTIEMHHHLNVSHNKFQCLHTSEMRAIDKIIHDTPGRRNLSKSFELNLSHNSLRCSCPCLEFFLWMKNVGPYITSAPISALSTMEQLQTSQI